MTFALLFKKLLLKFYKIVLTSLNFLAQKYINIDKIKISGGGRKSIYYKILSTLVSKDITVFAPNKSMHR